VRGEELIHQWTHIILCLSVTFVVTHLSYLQWIYVLSELELKQINITINEIALSAELNDSPTAREIWNELPIEGAAQTWGEEIYFSIPVNADEEPEAREIVEIAPLHTGRPGTPAVSSLAARR